MNNFNDVLVKVRTIRYSKDSDYEDLLNTIINIKPNINKYLLSSNLMKLIKYKDGVNESNLLSLIFNNSLN